ncbi:MAG: hypothetical protein V1912_03895 [bacterium]
MLATTRSSRFFLLLALSMLAFLLLASTALAHVPRLPGRGATLQTASEIDDPVTSWVFYGTIERLGETWYYRLDLDSGDRLFLQLLTPGRQGFSPTFAVMGPGLASEGQLPDFVETPSGASIVVKGGDLGEAEYEPFTPGAYYGLATMDLRVPQDGTYYVAVFDERQAGAFGLVVGYEERYTALAWIRLPADLLSIYAWDGGWAAALAPGIGILVVATGLILWRHRVIRRRRSVSGWLPVAAGLICLTTCAIVLTQMLRAAGRSGFDPAMGVTAFFIAAPAIVGGLLIWLGWSVEPVSSTRTRALLLVLGLAGLGLLAGYIVGPALALIAALAPPYRRRLPEKRIPTA